MLTTFVDTDQMMMVNGKRIHANVRGYSEVVRLDCDIVRESIESSIKFAGIAAAMPFLIVSARNL